MALPLWGELEKAQDDSTKIEAFIDAKIIEHENDPEAHLGAGESLEMHKTEEIIDHPATSIIPDKFSITQPLMTFIFNSTSGWITAGNVSFQINFGKLRRVGNVTGDLYAFTELIVVPPLNDADADDVFFQFRFKRDRNTYLSDWYFGPGVLDYPGPQTDALIFKLVDNELFSVISIQDVVTSFSLGTIDLTKSHSIRMILSKQYLTADIYLDSVLLKTWDITDLAPYAIAGWGICENKIAGTTSGQFDQLNFYYLQYSLRP